MHWYLCATWKGKKQEAIAVWTWVIVGDNNCLVCFHSCRGPYLLSVKLPHDSSHLLLTFFNVMENFMFYGYTSNDHLPLSMCPLPFLSSQLCLWVAVLNVLQLVLICVGHIQSLCSAIIEPICVAHVYLPCSLRRERCYWLFFCKWTPIGEVFDF